MMKYKKVSFGAIIILSAAMLIDAGCKVKLDTTWGKSATLGDTAQSSIQAPVDTGSVSTFKAPDSNKANQPKQENSKGQKSSKK